MGLFVFWGGGGGSGSDQGSLFSTWMYNWHSTIYYK